MSSGEAQLTRRGFGTSSEFVRELIRREQDRTRLREFVLDSATSDALRDLSLALPARQPAIGSTRLAVESSIAEVRRIRRAKATTSMPRGPQW